MAARKGTSTVARSRAIGTDAGLKNPTVTTRDGGKLGALDRGGRRASSTRGGGGDTQPRQLRDKKNAACVEIMSW